jgi:polyisoprenoid-binding protein YceI
LSAHRTDAGENQVRALILAAALLLPGAALATCPTGLPPGVFCGEPDPAAAPAGTYVVDPNHTAVVARVPHLGYSRSVFRFDKTRGTLTWDPASAKASNLTAEVDTGSIATPVAGFPAELSGPGYLKVAAFPHANFVSTAFRRVDKLHGDVDGQFTLMGVTHPMTFHVTLIGAGKGFGKPRLGIEAVSSLDPQLFGMGPFFQDPIQLVIDAEFVRQ